MNKPPDKFSLSDNLNSCHSVLHFQKRPEKTGESEADMDGGTAPAKRPKLHPHGKALRWERIFERMRGGWSYEAIAAEQGVTPRRIRQIISEGLAAAGGRRRA